MDGELFFEGIVVCGFDEGGCYASVADGTGDVGMDYVHDAASDDVCEVCGMAVCLDLETAEVFVVFHPCVHCIPFLHAGIKRVILIGIMLYLLSPVYRPNI